MHCTDVIYNLVRGYSISLSCNCTQLLTKSLQFEISKDSSKLKRPEVEISENAIAY